MRFFILFSALALTACVEGGGIPQSEAQAKVKAACDSGDVEACKFIAAQEQAERARVSAALGAMGQSMQQTNIANTYWAPQRALPQTTRCLPQFGQIVCQTY